MKNRSTGRLGGFTLIELLVVVLIIGVLTAVALPKYQGAVDKSRYSALMPMAKNIATSQEAFYLASGDYSEDLSNLDTQITKDTTGPTAELSDGTTLELSQRESHKYVKMSKDNLENNYIVYQNKSPNYAGEIHCEALKESTRAQRLCEILGGEKINGYLTPGYDTYVLEGTGLGMPANVADKIDQAGNGGWQTCDTYPCTKTCNRATASGYTCTGTYQEDGSYVERSCYGNICVEKRYDQDGKIDNKRTCLLEGNVCNTKSEIKYDKDGNEVSKRGCWSANKDGSCKNYSGYGGYEPSREYEYDENGNLVEERSCSYRKADGSCSGGYSYEYTYDEDGNKTSQRYCLKFNMDTGCSQYYEWGGYDYSYDENGNLSSERKCKLDAEGNCVGEYLSGTEYTYDENGNAVAKRECKTYDTNGTCTSYSGGSTYTYDENGNQTSTRQCSKWGADGSCASYSSSWAYDYTYDENGNKTSSRQCWLDYKGGCNSYRFGYEYTYDENGNKTSERMCDKYGKDGSCSSYATDRGVDYVYDANGNMTSERNCSTLGADGQCSVYSPYGNNDYTYDENGRVTSKLTCSSVGSDGQCEGYTTRTSSSTESTGYENIYDEEGNKIKTRYCQAYSEKECTRWRDVYY